MRSKLDFDATSSSSSSLDNTSNNNTFSRESEDGKLQDFIKSCKVPLLQPKTSTKGFRRTSIRWQRKGSDCQDYLSVMSN